MYTDIPLVYTELGDQIKGIFLQSLYMNEQRLSSILEKLPNVLQLEITHCSMLSNLSVSAQNLRVSKFVQYLHLFIS